MKNKYIWIPITLLIFCFTFFMTSLLFMDNDGWFILNNGKYILEHGIPKMNPFTFIPDLEIVIQQWAYSVLCFSLYDKFGYAGIYGLCISLFLLALFIYVKIAKIHEVPTSRAILFGSLIFAIMSGYLSIRPTFITVVLVLTQIYLMEQYKIKNKITYLLPLLLISLIEINVHSALWIIHFILLLPYLVPPIKNPFVTLQSTKYKKAPILLMIPIMFLVGFLNPYGWDGIAYIARSYGADLNSLGIIELKAPALDTIGVWYFIIACAFFYFIAKRKKYTSSLFYIMCGFLILGFSHTRNLIYTMLGFSLFLIDLYKKEPISLGEKSKPYSGNIFMIAVVILIMFFAVPIKNNVTNYQPKDCYNTPVKAVEYLIENNAKKIYTEFNAGGYFQFHGLKTFMEPRPELYMKKVNKKSDVLEDYKKIKKSRTPEELEENLEKYDFEYLCVSDKSPMNMYLSMSDQYKKVMNTKNEYALYEKR